MMGTVITKWVGDAYREFLLSKYVGLCFRLFQKTGCLFTANGSDNKFIQPEGLPSYVVAPPSLLDPSSGASVMGNDAATEIEENEAEETADFEGEKRTSKWLISRKKEGETYLTS